MNMSDVFELPIDERRIEIYGYDTVEPTSYQVAETAAAHAINCHDELVSMLVQLQTEGGLGVARHRQIDRLLAKARGE